MLDHILCYETVEDRPNAPVEEGQAIPPSWDDGLGRTWMPVECVITEAIYDDEGNTITPAVYAPGSWMVVRSATPQWDFSADPKCLIIADSKRAAAGEPFIILNRLQPTTILGRLSPIWAGDNYPFPSGPASNLEPLMVAA